jgi:hypothetical protein
VSSTGNLDILVENASIGVLDTALKIKGACVFTVKRYREVLPKQQNYKSVVHSSGAHFEKHCRGLKIRFSTYDITFCRGVGNRFSDRRIPPKK